MDDDNKMTGDIRNNNDRLNEINDSIGLCKRLSEEILSKRNKVSRKVLKAKNLLYDVEIELSEIDTMLSTLQDAVQQVETNLKVIDAVSYMHSLFITVELCSEDGEIILFRVNNNPDQFCMFIKHRLTVYYYSAYLNDHLLWKYDPKYSWWTADVNDDNYNCAAALKKWHDSIGGDVYRPIFLKSDDGKIQLDNSDDSRDFKLCFGHVGLDGYYKDALKRYEWYYTKQSWYNNNDLNNYLFIQDLIKEYDEISSDIDYEEYKGFAPVDEDLNTEEILYASEDGNITLSKKVHFSDTIYLSFGERWLATFYQYYLLANSWEYLEYGDPDRKPQAINDNNKNNLNFVFNLIGEYDSQDIENFSLSSKNKKVVVNTIDGSEGMELLFEYVYLDKYYQEQLENYSWSYNEDTKAWYAYYNYYNFKFVQKLIAEYDANPPGKDDVTSDELKPPAASFDIYTEDDDGESASDGERSYDDSGLSLQSALNKMGYNVNQKDDLSDYERQTILSKAIESGTYSKGRLINFLEWKISMAKKNKSMEVAISKWKRDIEYIRKHY